MRHLARIERASPRQVVTGALRSLLVLLSISMAAAQQQDLGGVFAGLTVVAFGDQEIDILTGVTTLPEGGQLIDRESGVTLTAGLIRYKEGEFVKAEEVEITGAFGVARAGSVHIDVAGGTLEAIGELSFDREDLGLEAEALHYYAGPAVFLFQGPVVGVGLEFEAAAVLLDGHTGELVLAAPYRYHDGRFELSSDREGALLSLTPVGGESLELAASSTVRPELLERLGPYLP